MRDRLRRFAVVGLIATVVDVGLLVQLLEWGWPVVAADVVALAVAALAGGMILQPGSRSKKGQP